MSRRFNLKRSEDISGISGVGVVATGVMFDDGKIEQRWQVWPFGRESFDSIDDMLYVHGHDGATVVEWIDQPEPEGIDRL